MVTINSRTRTGTGKSYTRKIRQQGWIPAVYYGHNKETMLLEVSGQEFTTIARTKKISHLVNLKIAEKDFEVTTVIKELQKHVLKDNVYFHIDFQHVAMDEKITVHCPIHLIGTAIGVTEESGVLNNPTRSVTIECLPLDIPEYIEVDVTELHMGDSICVKNLNIPKVEIKDSPQEVIVAITHPQIVAEIEPESSETEGEEETGEQKETAEK